MTETETMRTIRVWRAQDAARTTVEPVTIVIGDPIPHDDPARPISPEDSRFMFDLDAGAIAEVLWSTLPGGTLDALIGALLVKRGSLLHVPMSAVA